MDEENEVVEASEADLAAEGLDDDSLDAELAAYEAELRDAAIGELGVDPEPASPEQWRMPDVSAMSADEFADFMERDDRFGPDEDDVDEPRPLPAFMGLSDKAFDLAVERIGWAHTDPFADLDEVS